MEIFSNISKIIERDSKFSTYKFALLRGVIDMIQENNPFISFSNDRAYFPIGQLIEKWMVYYYPILESPILLPQINGSKNLAFEAQLRKIIFAYKNIGGLSAFYNDLKTKGIPSHLEEEFAKLAKIINHTITKMPMRYIGNSLGNGDYSIFNYESCKSKRISR
jgi:hypothetical protein